MSVFVDTGVLVAAQNKRDTNHKTAARALALIPEGKLGRPFTSDYVFDEAVTLARVRTASHVEAMKMANRIVGGAPFPRVLDMLMVTGPVFRDALRVFTTYKDKPLSFTDATTIALVQRRGIDRVMSFDSDFDGVVPRLDPRAPP